jgi:hypothetical protein
VKKTIAHSQNILHVDVLYNIKRKKKELQNGLCRIGIRQVTFDRMVMILYRTYNFFSLFAMQLDYCNIQRVFEQK